MTHIRHSSRFWWAALIVAWGVDFLFWKKIPGISIPLWVLMALTAGILLVTSEKVKVALPSLFLALAILVLASITFFRTEPMTRFVNALLSIGVLLLLSATLRMGDWYLYNVRDYVVAGFYLLVAVLSRPLELIISNRNREEEGEPVSSWRSYYRRMAPIVRGLLLAFPVMLVLGSLLASADPVFRDHMNRLLQLLDLSRIPEFFLRFFFIILPLTYLFCGVFLHAVHPKRQLTRSDNADSWFKPFLGWIECAVVLVGVNLLFAIFVAIQFRYLFGGEANISEVGYTYSDYARRGFGELLGVAILSLMLYLSLGTITRLDGRSKRIGFTSLTVILIGLVLVMLASAMKRLLLYENAYGFTRLRTYTHVFIIWLALLLCAMVLFEVVNRRRLFAISLAACMLGFSLTLGVINVDGHIVRQNVQRTLEGEELDTAYLRRLSSDSIPVMLDEYASSGISPQVREQIGLELVCRMAGILTIQEGKPRPWQSFHLGEKMNHDALLRRFRDWNTEYTLRREGAGWTVHSPNTPFGMDCYAGFAAWD